MNQTDLAFTPAIEQARLIRSKQVSPLELVELYLERIQRLDSQLGSYFTVMAEMALADAKAKTEALAGNTEQFPPFFGVPISIKDLNPVAGVRCTYGTAALMDKIAAYDDAVVTRIKLAGFTILGKTATSELGSFPYTEPPAFPPARNPWNLDYTPGGSSGGAAAAMAAGLCALAQGSDGGGSVRGPAACCGLVGIKPSRGRVSYAPVGDHLNGIATNGCLARNVADAAALLDVMSGYVTGDPYWLPDPGTTFLAATAQKLGSLRIAFSTAIPPIGEADSASGQAVQKTVQLLEEMGHTVEPGCPDFTDLIKPFAKVWQAGVAATGIPGDYLEPMNRWMLEQSGSVGEYLQAVTQMQITARRIVAFFDNYDVLVLPIYMHQPIRIGEWAHLNPEERLQKIIQWIAPCPPFNATGQPAISLPTGFDANGLPIGVQLVGRPADETTLIALAAQLEAAKLWSDRRPDFAAS
ncbi:amidase [Coleofasciculus sp. H7-2]|uniref:amidase n=1 Tax=Coleofasciculus sp. H7-2 TaxID=3351545 RepID=UPI0036730C1B